MRFLSANNHMHQHGPVALAQFEMERGISVSADFCFMLGQYMLNNVRFYRRESHFCRFGQSNWQSPFLRIYFVDVIYPQ